MNDQELMQRDAAYSILSTCQGVSPSGKEQAAFARIHNEVIMVSGDPIEAIKSLCDALLDGLRYGNWPKE